MIIPTAYPKRLPSEDDLVYAALCWLANEKSWDENVSKARGKFKYLKEGARGNRSHCLHMFIKKYVSLSPALQQRVRDVAN